ncbi:hypothetical protein BGZ73_001984 [Actinomortierella ambigua]|nr:hypothetical protein BGZ73_001984 [Actinomortierella ambigua]
MKVSFSVAAIAAVLATAVHPVHSYGILGHTLTGQVAQELLTPETARQIKEVLSPYYEGLLSKAAPWPDTVKSKPQYKWASEFHYINTPGDNPPEECRFEYLYEGHDVLNGIYNMSSQLLHYKNNPPTTETDRAQREDALRFFVHFMGDIHQPLHTSGKDRGGNDALARWGKTKTNLHSIWDTQLILKDIKDNFENDPEAYLEGMMEKTNSIWLPDAANWTVCDPDNEEELRGGKDGKSNPWSDSINGELAFHLCPKAWTRDMNGLVCQYAWKNYNGTEHDLSKEYYERATGAEDGFLVQRLIAMSGVRMAAILNAIYDPTSFSSHSLRNDWTQKPKVMKEMVAAAHMQRRRFRRAEVVRPIGIRRL